MIRAMLLIALATLAGCGGGMDNRYLLQPAPVAAPFAVRVSTIELRDVSLPSYATLSEILVQAPDGSVQSLPNAMWADDPVRSITNGLARTLDEGTTATVAAEPWPLQSRPAVRLDVRIEEMLARNDGLFALSGQYAVASPERVVRESVERFALTVPMLDTSPGSVATASGASITALAQQIARRLTR